MIGISAPVLSLTVGEAMADGWMAQDAEVAQHLRSFELSTIHHGMMQSRAGKASKSGLADRGFLCFYPLGRQYLNYEDNFQLISSKLHEG